jgi:hypothetical protein
MMKEKRCGEQQLFLLRFPTLVQSRSGSMGIISGKYATPAKHL